MLDWNVAALHAQLAPLLPGIEIDVVASIGSTSTALLDSLRGEPSSEGDEVTAMRRRSVESRAFQRRAPDRAPRLLVAELQTAGRGRQGRPWHATVGASLTFSLAVPVRRADLSGLSLAVGVALVEALDDGATRRLGIKWPNDLWLPDDRAPAGGRKLGGVLIETLGALGQRWLVIGIGLNVQPLDAADASTGVAALAELRADASAPRALALIAGPLARALVDFEREGFAAFADRFAARDLLQGRAVITTAPDAPEGTARGVDTHGALQVDTPAGRRSLQAGEVSVRPGSAPC